MYIYIYIGIFRVTCLYRVLYNYTREFAKDTRKAFQLFQVSLTDIIYETGLHPTRLSRKIKALVD